MKKFKKALPYIVVLIVVVLLFQILHMVLVKDPKKDEKETQTSEQSTAAYPKEDVEFLTKSSWAYYDPIVAEAAVLEFKQDGAFGYYCESGEPYGDYEPYDAFYYDEEKQMIIVYGIESGEEEREIKVLEKGDDRLVLLIDGLVKEFLPYEAGFFPPEIHEDCITMFEYSSSFETILGKEGNILKTAPGDYDGDVKEHREKIRDIQLADGAIIEEVVVRSVMKDGREKTTITHTELSEKELNAMLKDSSQGGYIWYDEDMQVQKIILYGETLIWK